MIYPDPQFLVMFIWGLITLPTALLTTVGFIAASVIMAVLSRRSFHRQSIALLCILGMMVIQSLELVMLALHVQILGPPSGGSSPVLAGMSNCLIMLFQANLWFAVLGAAAAGFVAFYVYFGESRLEMLRASPSAELIENPTWLRETVLRLANGAKVKCPEVCLVDSGTPQAFTVRAKGKYVIGLSVGILECFDTKEVEACIAHEIAHIKNNDFVIRFLATLGKVAVFSRPASHLIEAAIYRTREFHADRTAASLIGGPDALISLLTKLSGSNSRSSIPTASGPVCRCLLDRSGGMRRILNKHPALESRIRLLNELTSS
jgi:heat shock protein HtpX